VSNGGVSGDVNGASPSSFSLTSASTSGSGAVAGGKIGKEEEGGKVGERGRTKTKRADAAEEEGQQTHTHTNTEQGEGEGEASPPPPPPTGGEIFTHDEIVTLRLIFALFDDNGDDYLDQHELLRYSGEWVCVCVCLCESKGIFFTFIHLFTHLSFYTYIHTYTHIYIFTEETGDCASKHQAEEIISLLDVDGDGRIGLYDYVCFAARLKELHRKNQFSLVMSDLRASTTSIAADGGGGGVGGGGGGGGEMEMNK
jgi:hypothetical protein